MLHSKKTLFLILLMMLTLMGCKRDLTYSYFIEHPMVLKQTVESCQLLNEKSPEEIAQCAVARDAATTLTSVISEQQADPEKFGQRVMAIEAACVQAKETMMVAKKSVDALLMQKAPAAQLQAAQVKLAAATKVYQDQRNEMKMLLAVLGMASPE